MTAASVVLIGDAGIDLYRLPEGDRWRPGGCTLNVAFNLQDLPATHTVEVIAPLGDAPESRRLQIFLEDAPFRLRVPACRGKPATQSLEIGLSGERRFVGYDPGPLSSFVLDDSSKESLRQAAAVVTVVFTQNEALAWQVLGEAKAAAVPLRVCDFMDLSDAGADPLEFLRRGFALATLGFVGLPPERLGLLADLGRLMDRLPGRMLAVTLGAKGSVVFGGQERHEAEAIPVAEVVDTTGAGDAFLAAFVAARLAGRSLGEAQEAGHLRAATVVQHWGAFPAPWFPVAPS